MELIHLGKTAFEAVDVIIHHIEKYGQGGPCRCSIMHKFAYFLSTVGDWSYHNSFLVADPKEAYVLETAGAWWVAERVTCGPRNISNGIISVRIYLILVGVSITTSYFKAREGIVEHAKAKGYLKTDEYGGSRHGLIPVSSGKMNFRDSFSTSCVQISEDEWKADSREETVRCMLDDARKMSENKDVIKLMKSVLSEHNTGELAIMPAFVNEDRCLYARRVRFYMRYDLVIAARSKQDRTLDYRNALLVFFSLQTVPIQRRIAAGHGQHEARFPVAPPQENINGGQAGRIRSQTTGVRREGPLRWPSISHRPAK